jgi:apolipoprotein N-acyltransferase
MNLFVFGLLAIISICTVLASPRWGVPVFPWLTPIFLLFLFRLVAVSKKSLWVFGALVLGHFFADYDVVPFPPVVLLIYALYQAIEQVVVYLADRWVTRNTGHFAGTLFFPAACVGLEFINTVNSGGIWWSVANTQYSFTWLTQLTSVTGMWGISFLIFWTASVVVWAIGRYRQQEKFRFGLGVYGGVLVAVLIFGGLRYAAPVADAQQRVRTAGVTVPLVDLWQAMYKDYSGRDIIIDPRSSITDPVFRQIGVAKASYVASADTVKFRNAFAVMNKTNDSLFALSQRAVERGAKIICWSEGNGVVFKSGENDLVKKGRLFSARNSVYLLMTAIVIHPGPITPGKKFLENEAIFIGPEGSILTRFYKNNPVPMVEASAPGDGHVPVVETRYGRVAVSICYDADFPKQMRQVSDQRADLLLLPSGDWSAISPYHTYMGLYRGVENGCSVLREVSGGLSVATDNRGKAIGQFDYFRAGTKLWLADLPVGHRATLYARVGDAMAWGCLLCAGLTVLILVVVRSRRRPVLFATDRMALPA